MAKPIHDVLQRPQFSILAMLGLTTLIALIATQNSFWATVAAVEMIAIYLFVTSLIRSLPVSIIAAMDNNCYRLDGTLDPERSLVEQNELKRLFWHILFTIFLLVLVPLNSTLWFCREYRIGLEDGNWIIGLIWLILTFIVIQYAYLQLLNRFLNRVMQRRDGYLNSDPISNDPLDG